MNESNNYHFGIKVDKHLGGVSGIWSFGSCLSHSFGETYLFINFLFWSISIGWLRKPDEYDI